MAAGAAKAFSRIVSNPSEAWDRLTGGKWDQYTTGTGPEGQYKSIGPLGHIKRWGDNMYNMIGSADAGPSGHFYPNNVLPGMHPEGNTATPSQKQLLAGEPDLKFMNRGALNAQLTDQRRQLREGINPNDVLSGADLSEFYNEIYKPGVNPKEALQDLAEKLFIQRGVDKAAERSASDETGKLTSLKQKTIKGEDPHRLTQRLAKNYIPDDATFVDTETGIETPVTQEELIAAGIIKAPRKAQTTTTGSGFGGFGSGGAFGGFGKLK
jgi:hypothetical protein